MREAEKILERTRGGLDVFRHYLGDACRSGRFRNPYREDRRPSCRLYFNKPADKPGYYFLQDYGDSNFCGNCFSVVAKLTGIDRHNDFKRLLEQIDNDMGLGVFSSYGNDFSPREVNLRKVTACSNMRKNTAITKFSLVPKTFSVEELAYWQHYGITLDVLDRYEVKSVKSCTFEKSDGNSFALFSTPQYPMYGYCFNGGTGIKLYRPKSENRFLYAGQLPKPYVFGWSRMPDKGETVFITGGEKDVLALVAHGFCAIAFNSETAKIPEGTMTELSRRFKRIVFVYDSDATGKKESLLRVNEFCDRYRVSRLELPLPGTKKEKDISDFFAMGKSGIDLINLMDI